MPLFVVYDPNTGDAISTTGTDTPNCLDRPAIAAKGLAIKDFLDIDEPNIPRGKRWNSATLELDDYTPDETLNKEILIGRLTNDEMHAIKQINNNKLQGFLERLKFTNRIVVNDPETQQIFNGLVTAGVFTAERKDEILATEGG